MNKYIHPNVLDPKPSWGAILALLFCLIAGAVGFNQSWGNRWRLQLHGVPATAQIIRQTHPMRTPAYVTYAYTVQEDNGRSQTFTASNYVTQKEAFYTHEGAIVSIRYLPTNPQIAIIVGNWHTASGDLRLLTLFIAPAELFAAVLLVLHLHHLYTYTRRHQNHADRHAG